MINVVKKKLIIVGILFICITLTGCGNAKEKTLEEKVVGNWYDATNRMAVYKMKLYDTKKCTIEENKKSQNSKSYMTNCSWEVKEDKIIISYQNVSEYQGNKDFSDVKVEYELVDDNLMRNVNDSTIEYSRED